MIRIKNYIIDLNEIVCIEFNKDQELLRIYFKSKTPLFISEVNEVLFNDLWHVIVEENKLKYGIKKGDKMACKGDKKK